MDLSDNIACPVCSNGHLTAKYEATYVYSYAIDSDAPGLKNTEEFLPFMFDKREQKEAKQYIECGVCGSKFPCFFSVGNKGVDFAILQKAIHPEHVS